MEIKNIFCKVMEQRVFNGDFFTENVEQMVIQANSSIDIHLKDGMVRTYKTCKLRGNRHETTFTEKFTGKIVCASCGNLYHKYSCYRKYVYWRCSGKSKVRTECSGRNFQDSDIRKVSVYMMGMEKFDGAEFDKAIDHITALEDGSLEFHFYNGRAERWQR